MLLMIGDAVAAAVAMRAMAVRSATMRPPAAFMPVRGRYELHEFGGDGRGSLITGGIAFERWAGVV